MRTVVIRTGFNLDAFFSANDSERTSAFAPSAQQWSVRSLRPRAEPMGIGGFSRASRTNRFAYDPPDDAINECRGYSLPRGLCASKPSIGLAVLVPVSSGSLVPITQKNQVDVRVFAVVFVISRSDDQEGRVLR
jgi:hypothetical protein